MKRNGMLICCLFVMTFLAGTALAQERARLQTFPKPPLDAPVLSTSAKTTDDTPSPQQKGRTRQASHATKREQSERAEGEQRFRENCGRCHQPPHKFSRRVMAAAIRHMRVRAMLTDEDMRLILKYMTQ